MSEHVSIHERGGRDPALLDAVSALAIPALADGFAGAIEQFDDVLFDRAERAGPSQMDFLDAMRELRRRREEIAQRFRAYLVSAWQAFEAGTPLSAENVLADHAESLTLVTEQQLESRLAVRNLATVLQRDHKPVLTRLDRRLGLIGGLPELDADHNPIGSEHLGVAVHEAFNTCDLTLEVRLVVLKLSERYLLALAGKVYDGIDQHLAQAGVIPGLTGTGTASRPAIRRAAEPVERADPEQETAEGDAPAWAARFVQRMHATRHGVSPATDHALDESVATATGSQGVLLEALHHLLQEVRTGRQQDAPQPQDTVIDRRALSHREMMSVLSLLQGTPSPSLRAAIAEEGESLSQRLKSEVLSGATQLGVDPSSARLASVDEDAIDLVGMLFDVMLDERDLEGRSRDLIGRLVVPFVKVALLDRHMFVQKTHPARRLLNLLAEACEGCGGESAAERVLLGKVEEVVERLVAEFNENLAIFQTLEEEFRGFLDQHRRRIEIAERRTAEIQRGQERLDAARSRMHFELNLRLEGRRLPQAIEDFMRQPWSHHVTMTLLREGEEGEGLPDALELADGLLEEVDEAQRHIVGKPWLQALRPALLRVFASVGVGGDAAESAVEALHDTLQAVAAARPDLEKSLPELPQVSLPGPAPVEDTSAIQLVAGTDMLDFDHADADQFRTLAIGTWLDFIDKDNRVQAGKLSWVSPISKRLLFVNRRGVRFCVASPEELAAMVRLGRLRTHVDEDAFDSAMQGVINRLEPELQAQA